MCTYCIYGKVHRQASNKRMVGFFDCKNRLCVFRVHLKRVCIVQNSGHYRSTIILKRNGQEKRMY